MLMFPGSVVGGTARRSHWKALRPATGLIVARADDPPGAPLAGVAAPAPGAGARLYVRSTFPPASRISSVIGVAESGSLRQRDMDRRAVAAGCAPPSCRGDDWPPASTAGRGAKRCTAVVRRLRRHLPEG